LCHLSCKLSLGIDIFIDNDCQACNIFDNRGWFSIYLGVVYSILAYRYALNEVENIFKFQSVPSNEIYNCLKVVCDECHNIIGWIVSNYDYIDYLS
jgi:hypothetical protein